MIASSFKKLNAKFLPQKLFYAPEWLVLGVNNVCNLHCKMCDVGTGYSESNFAVNLVGTHPINMPLELIKKIIDDSAINMPSVKLGYAFTEPLVYPHLIESLFYAQSKKLYTSVTTNALTLPKHAKQLCESGLNDLFISLDGPEEIHNMIRGHKSSFQKAIEGIEKLIAEKNPPNISIFCTITEWNIGSLKKFADFFKKYPLKQLGFMHTNFTPDDVVIAHNKIYGNTYPATISNVTETHIGEMNLQTLWKEVQDIKRDTYPFRVSFSPEINSFEILKVFYNKPDVLIGKKCNDTFRNIMIKSDGSVIPSHGRCYNINMGNVYNNSISEIWNSAASVGFRKDLIKAGGLFPACARCCSAF